MVRKPARALQDWSQALRQVEHGSPFEYAHDPRSDAGAEDYLGLISSKDVEIAPPM